MNPSAVLIADVSLATPIEITTAATHPFASGDVIIIKIPKADGLQNPTVPSWKEEDFFVSGIITRVDDTHFIIPGNTTGLTAFSGVEPAYATPATYSCSQFVSPTYLPAYRLISNITNSNPAVVTTTIDHGYSTGLIVRLKMPSGIGMYQANNLTGTITVTGSNTFTIPIDTTNFDSFIVYDPNHSANQHVNICALAVPIGEDSAILSQATRNVLV